MKLTSEYKKKAKYLYEYFNENGKDVIERIEQALVDFETRGWNEGYQARVKEEDTKWEEDIKKAEEKGFQQGYAKASNILLLGRKVK